MKPIRIGVIGCGVIANSAHYPALAKTSSFDLVAVCDILEDRAAKAAEQFGVGKTYTEASELIADNRIDAVIFALPAGVRTPLVYRALKQGKHVLVEKPSAGTVAEMDRFAALAGSSTAAFCSPRFTFTQSAAVAADAVKSGALGRIREVRAFIAVAAGKPPAKTPPPWRESFSLNGGGILMNWGCYDLDYLLWVAGDVLKPKEVFAHWWPVSEAMSDRVGPEGDADAHYSAAVRCEGNILLSIERAEFSSMESQAAWQIIGDRGSLSLNLMPGQEKRFVLNRIEPKEGLLSETLWEGTDSEDISVELLEDFASAIRRGTEPRTGIEKARLIQTIYDGVYRSATAGKSVSVL
jgi:predicted dehydrogenase